MLQGAGMLGAGGKAAGGGMGSRQAGQQSPPPPGLEVWAGMRIMAGRSRYHSQAKGRARLHGWGCRIQREKND